MNEPTDINQVLENLATLALVVRDDAGFRTWFRQLERLTALERRNEVYRMVEQIRSSRPGENPDVVRAFGMLADERVFAAAQQAIRLP
jgi:hypothetical protein